MQHINRKLAVASIALLLGTSSCGFFEVDEVIDPNNPSLDTVLSNATRPQLDALAVGVEASYRLQHTGNAPYNWVIGTLGREITVLASNESRWYQELQGTRAGGTLDDAAYYNAYYTPLSQMRRAAQVYRESANNSPVLTTEQKSGVAGFTHTYEALAKLLLLNMQGDNGIRIAVDDYQNPGPFVQPAEALTDIKRLLDLGSTELGSAGAAFGFTLSSGYAGFNTPATFRQFNRALAARVALYQKDYPAAQTALSQSFYSPSASLTLGPKITFNPANAGDQGNSYFQVNNTSAAQAVTVPENFIQEADTIIIRKKSGTLDSVVVDARVRSKTGLRATPRSTGGITAPYEVRRFATNTTPLDIIRNEELILIAAEVKANSGNLAGALADVNVIRRQAGELRALPAGSFTTVEVAVNEILKQRRYSLFYEGHRFVDLRRLGKLNPNPAPGQTLTFATGDYKLIDRMPRPAAEKAWDSRP
jgi:starch-binding outer membrane protein, SusD/RagB family